MSSRPGSRDILNLAHWQASERDRFEVFLSQMRSLLSRESFSFEGRRADLAGYLDWRRKQGIAKGAGDEQSVVDVLVRQLLEALGYSQGDFVYNRRLSGSPERAVPDYTVYVEEYLGRIPVLLVESKATSVLEFQRSTRAGGEDRESPLDQLRRYVLSGAVHGRMGLLCNGWRLEAWEFGGDGDTRLLQVDLDALSHAASGRGDAGAFPAGQRSALLTLWNRFSHDAFLQARDLRETSLETQPMPTAWIEKIRNSFASDGRPRVLSEELVDYYESQWKSKAHDVREVPELLVQSLRGLIEQFAEDVHHQLEDALMRRQEYEKARRQTQQGSKVAGLRQRLALRQQSFTLSKEDFDRELLNPLDEWCRRPRLEEKQEVLKSWIEALSPFVKVSNGQSAEQMSLGVATRQQKKLPQAKNGEEAAKKRTLDALTQDLEEVCQSALKDFVDLQQLGTDFRTSLRASDSYQNWAERVSSSVLVGAEESVYRREFALQTAYVYIIRLLLVRICEDKGLFHRKLSDGGLILWQESAARYLDYASGRSYEYLTRMAYECAQNVYVHFYGASELFDWYRMDEKMLLRALLVLDAFNLAEIDTDIIGAVYGRYLEEGKHEQGRYYTPHPLVVQMLDMMGYQGEAIVNRRIADLACGSGSFLVEACRRLLGQFRGRDGRIPKNNLKAALEEVQRSIYGLEINPFACYLAETNLLIQVLDLIRLAKDEGITLVVNRFQIYSVDSLLVNDVISTSPEATLLLGKDVVVPELMKARAGEFRDGFDFLVGNPPYVRADEDAAYLAYRRRVELQDWFTTRHLKWDLYVPFVEQYYRLLSEKPGARCSLVTIESIATSPYGEKLRGFLAKNCTIYEILFSVGLKLFTEAKWQNNIIFSFSKGAPPDNHYVRRLLSKSRKKDGHLEVVAMDEVVQGTIAPDRLFNRRPEVDLDLSNTVLCADVCYVTVGMVLNSDEDLAEGEIVLVPPDYDPERFGEEVVEDLGSAGKRVRHRTFRRQDLISDFRDDIHTHPYIGSRQVLRGGVGTVQWLEYGSHTRCPSRVRRPTFPELYDRTKIIFGAFMGVAVDTGENGGYLLAPHTVRLAVRWCDLTDVQNRSLAEAREELVSQGRYDPALSREFSEWYLCAITLSEPIQAWLYANKRSMKDDVYPKDIEAIPVKILSPNEQEPFVRLERERHRLQRELVMLKEQGFRIGGKRIDVPVHTLATRFRQGHPEIEHLTLFQIPRSVLEIEESFYERDLHRVRAVGDELRVGREVFARIGEGISRKEAVARFLARYFADMPGTLAERQTLDALPRNEKGLLNLAQFVEEQEEGVRKRQARIAEIQQEIDRRAWALYRPESLP